MTSTSGTTKNEVPIHPQRKTLNPGLLGAGTGSNSHGMKLPPKMTFEDKSQFMNRWQEWRKAKLEKIASTSGKKEKPTEKPSSSHTVLKEKLVTSTNNENVSTSQDKQPSVYERLYKNTPRVSSISSKSKIPKRPSTFVAPQQKKLIKLKTNAGIKATPEEELFVTTTESIAHSGDILKEKPQEKVNKAVTSLPIIQINDVVQEADMQTGEEYEEMVNEKIEEKFEDDSKADGEEEEDQENKKANVEEDKNNNTDVEEEERIDKNLDYIENKGTTENGLHFQNSDSAKEPPQALKTKDKLKKNKSVNVNKTSTKVKEDASDVKKKVDLKKKPTILSRFKVTAAPRAPKQKVKAQLPAQIQEPVKTRNPLRRSISMIHRQKKGSADEAIHRANSEFNLPSLVDIKVPKKKKMVRFPSDPEISSQNSSILHTPTNKTATTTEMREKLDSWLTKHGHSVNGYRHLRCFGLDLSDVPGTPTSHLIDSPNTSSYITAPNTPINDSEKENETPPTAIQRFVDLSDAEKWLTDLHNLIVEVKYPYNRCDEWLTAIRRKCPSCSQLPIYWECLAALESSRDHFESAIECYERAIIKGAEVDTVSESLSQLFDNMVLENPRKPQQRLEKDIDVKNILKSKVIKFALQQKALKEMEPELGKDARRQLLVATPVRRSTRILTPYKSNVVNTLQSLDPEMKDHLQFQSNDALLTG